MFMARLSVCTVSVSGFKGSLTDQINADRLMSKSLGSYPLQQSRQLCLTTKYKGNLGCRSANHAGDHHDNFHSLSDTSTTKLSKSEGALSKDLYQLSNELDQAKMEIRELKKVIQSALKHLITKLDDPPIKKVDDPPIKKVDDPPSTTQSNKRKNDAADEDASRNLKKLKLSDAEDEKEPNNPPTTSNNSVGGDLSRLFHEK